MHFQVVGASERSKSLTFVKRGAWVVFLQVGSSKNEQSLFVQEKSLESCLWAINTFLRKAASLKFFSILEENCGADILNGTFNCEIFVHKWCKKRPLSKLYLPTKALFF